MRRHVLNRSLPGLWSGRGALALALAVGLTICLAAPAVASAGQLPEFNLLGFNGGSDITSMNMTTGEFSGIATVAGEEFTIEGTETGDESTSVLTWIAEPSYKSTNTDFYELLPDGSVGGDGEFTDTNGTHETYFGEINQPEATVPATVSVSCANLAGGYTAYSCTTTVAGSGGVPSGNITLSASSGSFPGPSQCVLSAGTCSVEYATPADGLAHEIKMTAVYSADATFRAAEASTKICGSGGVTVTAASPEGSHAHGAVVGNKIKLTGTGFCPKMKVQFGNEKAVVEVPESALDAEGTSATMTVPRLASTGTLTVTSAGQPATLASPLAIDSYRNTEGFQFANLPHTGNYAELTGAFGSNATYETITVNTCAPETCITHQLSPIRIIQNAFAKIYLPSEERGLCYGMALASLQFASGAVALSNFSSTAQDAFELGSTGGPGPALEAFLANRFLLQYSDQARASRRLEAASATRTAATLRTEIETAGSHGAIITLSGTAAAGAEGHAMVATGVEDIPEHEGAFLVNVIDSDSQYIAGQYSEEGTDGMVHSDRVTQIQVEPDGQWTYPSLSMSGSLSDILTTPLSLFNGPLTLGGKGGGPGLITASVPSGVGLAGLEDEAGGPLALNDPASGVVAEPPISGPAQPVPNASFSAPLGAYTDTLAAAGKPIEETWMAPGLLGSADGSSVKAAIGFDPKSVRVSYSPLQAPGSGPTALTLISSPANSTTRSATASFSSAAAAVTAALGSGKSGLTVTTTAATKVTITLEQTGGADALIDQHVPAFALGAGASAVVRPATWGGRSSQAVLVTIRPRHGRAHTLHLAARAPVAKSPIRITDLRQRRVHGHVMITMQLDTPSLTAGSTEAVNALLTVHGARARSYRLLASRPATAGKQVLSLVVNAGSRPARLKIILDSVQASTATLALRTVTVRVRG